MNDQDSQTVRIGTRGSALVRWQAEWVAAKLAATSVSTELVPITTLGDTSSGPIGAVGRPGVFTKEIQRALLDGRIDVAVHSLKDLPTDVPEGLMLAAVPRRESTGDALITSCAATLSELPEAARIGTGSTRRRAQLLAFRRTLVISDLRGNVDTRLRKLDDGQFDAIILAEAGLRRLGLEHRIAQVIPPEIMLPAVGQGALGLETRADDERIQRLLQVLNDRPTYQAVSAERTLLAQLQGGCLAPLGAWARCNDAGQLQLDAVVLHPQGRHRIVASSIAELHRAEELGREVAQRLLDQGAAELLARNG